MKNKRVLAEEENLQVSLLNKYIYVDKSIDEYVYKYMNTLINIYLGSLFVRLTILNPFSDFTSVVHFWVELKAGII